MIILKSFKSIMFAFYFFSWQDSPLHNNLYSISEVASSVASSYSNPHQIRRIPTLSSREHIWGNLRQTRMIPVDGVLAMQLWDELSRVVVL